MKSDTSPNSIPDFSWAFNNSVYKSVTQQQSDDVNSPTPEPLEIHICDGDLIVEKS